MVIMMDAALYFRSATSWFTTKEWSDYDSFRSQQKETIDVYVLVSFFCKMDIPLFSIDPICPLRSRLPFGISPQLPTN